MFYIGNVPAVRCDGNGHGVCFRCKVVGNQPIHWMTMLYRCECFSGLICSSCLRTLASCDPDFVREVV